ncbi:MAG: 8-oxoguanine deaminase [Armatimonadetes bacterium]|nr:MAG: 8-oxoguanine deaminase [Armatimonadota bacterium]
MPSLLLKNASVLVTMDAGRREIAAGALYAVDGIIHRIGTLDEMPETADDVVDLAGHIVLPGFINTHHHFYQTLTRAVPGAQEVGLFDWLKTLYPIWAKMTPDHVASASRIALAELALSGCTTAFDHQYIFPNGSRLDDAIEAAHQVGLRFHASRGSMSLGESDGGLPPDSVVEDEEAILADTLRLIDAYHDPTPGSMIQIAVAPCSPFSVTPDLMAASADLARDKAVRLHTHLAETLDEETFCIETFGKRPVELAEDLSWVGEDVWFAHGVFINDAELGRMGAAGTGVAHCPTSNMRLSSGIAPVRRMRARGVPVGIGVDGSASNDGSNLLAEVRQAMLVARLDASPNQSGGELMPARTALELATLGGARLLGRSDIGALAVGMCADVVAIDLGKLEYAGALGDPVAAVVFGAPTTVDQSWVHGQRVIENGALVTMELEPAVEQHNRLARSLVS